MSRAFLWEYMKLRIKRFTVEYCKMKASRRNYVIKMLESQIDDFDSLLSHDKNENILRKRKECKLELDNLSAGSGWIPDKINCKMDRAWRKMYLGKIENSRQFINVMQSLKDKEKGKSTFATKAYYILHFKFYKKNLFKTESISNEDVDRYINSIPNDLMN